MGIDPTAFIHEKAHVDNATIGARTKVWQFASVIRWAVLGDDCSVANCSLIDGAKFGDRCIVSQCCAIGPGFMVGNDVFVGPSVTFCNDAWPAVNKDNFHPELLTTDLVSIRVKDGASIGAGAILLPGIVIGKGAMIAANATVGENVLDGHLFTRDGYSVKIKPHWREKRMREASCLL